MRGRREAGCSRVGCSRATMPPRAAAPADTFPMHRGVGRGGRGSTMVYHTFVTFQARPYMLWASGLQGWTVPGMRRVRYYLTSYKLALPDITRVPPATNIALRRRLATEWKMCARDDSEALQRRSQSSTTNDGPCAVALLATAYVARARRGRSRRSVGRRDTSLKP